MTEFEYLNNNYFRAGFRPHALYTDYTSSPNCTYKKGNNYINT